MSRRLARAAALLSMAVTAVACGESDEERTAPEDVTGLGGARSSSSVPIGVVEVYAHATAHGDLVYAFQGPAEAKSGSPSVRCTHYPNGREEGSPAEVEILAGFAREKASIAVILHGATTNVGLHAYSYDGGVTDPALEARIRLTYDDPTTYLEYGPSSRDDVTSECAVEVERRGDYLVGGLSCRDLFPTATSQDMDVPGSFAGITLEFSCPLAMGEAAPMPDEPGDPAEPPLEPTDPVVQPSGECVGVATPCSLLSTGSCAGVTGCRLDGDCSGYAGSCYLQSNRYGCSDIDGCYWSAYYDNCRGSAHPCSYESTEYTCERRSGCNWSKDCTGIAGSCSLHDTETSCEDQPGCRWEGDL